MVDSNVSWEWGKKIFIIREEQFKMIFDVDEMFGGLSSLKNWPFRLVRGYKKPFFHQNLVWVNWLTS